MDRDFDTALAAGAAGAVARRGDWYTAGRLVASVAGPAGTLG